MPAVTVLTRNSPLRGAPEAAKRRPKMPRLVGLSDLSQTTTKSPAASEATTGPNAPRPDVLTGNSVPRGIPELAYRCPHTFSGKLVIQTTTKFPDASVATDDNAW